MGKVDQAVELLLAERARFPARRDALPAELVPENLGEAYTIQHRVTGHLGVIGGWKVLTKGPGQPLFSTAIPVAYVRSSGAHLAVEGEREIRIVIVAKLGASLAREDAPFTREQAEAAIAVIHPGVEILEPRIADAPPESPAFVADSLAAGRLVVGRSIQTWRGFNPVKLAVQVTIGSQKSRLQGSAEVDIPGALQWLSGEAATWWGGLFVGQVIEIGLGLPTMKVPSGSSAHVAIAPLGHLDFTLVPRPAQSALATTTALLAAPVDDASTA